MELAKIKLVENSADRRQSELKYLLPNDIKINLSKFSEAMDKKYYNYVKVYFKNKKYQELFKKIIKVSEYIEPNTQHIEPIIAFLMLIDKGFIKLDKDIGKLKLTLKGGVYEFEWREWW